MANKISPGSPSSSPSRIDPYAKNKVYRPVQRTEPVFPSAADCAESAARCEDLTQKQGGFYEELVPEKTRAGKRSGQRKKKTSKKRFGFGFVALTLVIGMLLGFFTGGVIGGAFSRKSEAGMQPESFSLKSIVDSTELMQYVSSIKTDLKNVLSGVKESDFKKAFSSLSMLDSSTAGLKEYLSSPFWQLAAKTPGPRRELAAAHEVIDLLEHASVDILWPLVTFAAQNPLSGLVDKGYYNVKLIFNYLDFVEDILPLAEAYEEHLKKIDFGLIDHDGKITGYIDTIDSLLKLYHENESYIPLIRKLFDPETEKVYLVVAQNSAEIRAAGGFPGSVSVLTIQYGYLKLQGFQTVYAYFPEAAPATCEITKTEHTLFQGLIGVPWDSVFCPDFPRVASIMAASFESMYQCPVSGIISATPLIIQKLLSIAGEITLDDGNVLNGENAIKVLQHDLYYQYLGSTQVENGAEKVDGIFSEVANKTIAAAIDTISVDKISQYIDAVNDLASSRNFMMYMFDEELQSMIDELGWSGTIGSAKEEPTVGIYFNGCTASKLGWYIDIETEVGDAVKNKDGSVSYDLTVTFTNTLTKEERDKGSLYINGEYKGALVSSAMIFAPNGGTITKAKSKQVPHLQKANYKELDVIYFQNNAILMGDSVTITCVVTTAPGVDAPLKFSMTPTLTDYR